MDPSSGEFPPERGPTSALRVNNTDFRAVRGRAEPKVTVVSRLPGPRGARRTQVHARGENGV